MSSQNTSENNDTLPGDSAVFYWRKLILAGILVLFIATNIALVKRYRYEKKMRVELVDKYQKIRSSLEAAGLQQAANWQAELQTWPIIEEGAILIQQKKYKEALKKFDTIASTGFEHVPIVYFFRGQVFGELGEHERAIRDLSKYYDIIASSHYTLYLRAKSYLGLGEKKLAIEDLKQAIQHAGNFAEAEALLKTIK
ncbi:hypothetical protein [Candidatus Uabimicrobium amorphum]|uniref:Tetratricopeptide repeat-like domain-containing protein n=1 Tax=Uabimicrobium amorphum TaxID=2596890 RepID=A0A5S9F3A9_UABAM|nr:hypothetical protein [Candidatus Uabimicrobium amorphum]BBM84061.1 hypothetical protein UABAM_02416 [Candidatus Uabimicrobium amorphum]